MDPIRETARFLQRRGLRLATAESCTAGLIASHIADVPGCGGTLQCAIVAYSPEAKKEILGVSATLIERHGLTSEAVSLAMAHGVMKISQANVAVANTGVADDGAPDGTEPGTQCFAWLIRLPGRAALPHAFTETRRFAATVPISARQRPHGRCSGFRTTTRWQLLPAGRRTPHLSLPISRRSK